MRLVGADVRVFGALRGLQVRFAPGVNLIVGPNEAGKSTLFSAVRHTLLTASRQSPSQLGRTLGRHFPRPDGSVIECELLLAADDEYRLRKRWGGDAATSLLLPDGAELSGEDAERRLAELLPVSGGTYATMFLVDQSQLEHTLDRLRRDVTSRDELATILREARSETGGVSVEAFERRLDERFRAMFGRWDLERDRPEGGRGLERPWVNGVGELLRAYYALQRARTEEQSILRAEEELERASELLDEVTARVRDAETLVADHASAFDAVSRLPSIERELETQRLALADVRAAVRRWPVLEEEIVRTREQLAAAEHDAAAAEQRLGDASVRRREAEERARFLRAREARQARDAARQRLDAIAPVDPEALAQLREAERRRSELRAKLSVGTLRVTLRSASGAAVSVRLDGEGPREVRIAEAGEQRLEAHRRVGVSAGDLTVDVETGDEPFEELRGRHDATEQDVAAIAAAIGAADAEEASARAGERSAAERELRELQRRLDEVLGETSWDVLAAQFDGAGTQPGTIEGDAPADDRQLARDLADARMRVGELRSGVRNLERERASLVERFESQDALEDRLAEIRVRVGELESQRAEVPAIPSGFASAQAFLSAYERTRDQLPRLREERHAAREAQVDLLARQPEQSGEEAREAVDLAEAEYDRVRKQADALIRLREATAQTLAEQRDDPFEPFARLVGRYLEIASGSRYRALPSADPLAPERYARETGPELDFELLSQGTRDMVALAVRLALAQSSAGAQSAPLLLDDPLVDMDPERRTNAVRAIEAYASGSDDPQRQVLIFTCHPDHADLFRGATRVELG